jgi:hypothetical protein
MAALIGSKISTQNKARDRETRTAFLVLMDIFVLRISLMNGHAASGKSLTAVPAA